MKRLFWREAFKNPFRIPRSVVPKQRVAPPKVFRFFNIPNLSRIARENGYTQVVEYLAENGNDVHDKNRLYLHIACEIGYFEAVKYLVENGTDIHDEALHLALDNGHTRIVQFLVQNGAVFQN
jgi:ankyrin repeat protein